MTAPTLLYLDDAEIAVITAGLMLLSDAMKARMTIFPDNTFYPWEEPDEDYVSDDVRLVLTCNSITEKLKLAQANRIQPKDYA